MGNLEIKNEVIEALEFLTKSELEQLNDFLKYKKINFSASIITKSPIQESAEEDRIISFFHNCRVPVHSINELVFYMKWTKFKTSSAGYIYEISIRNWFREFFDFNNEKADDIINYLIISDYLCDNGFGNYFIK